MSWFHPYCWRDHIYVICGNMRYSPVWWVRADTGSWTLVFWAYSDITVLAFFFQMYAPVVDLQHWVIGSGRNLVACVFSKTVQSSEWMAGRRGRNVASCQGLSLRGDPRTLRPTLSAPLPTDPLNPDPEELRPQSTVSPNLRWAWQEASGAPQKEGRGGIHEKKRKLFMRWADVWMEERGIHSA